MFVDRSIVSDFIVGLKYRNAIPILGMTGRE